MPEPSSHAMYPITRLRKVFRPGSAVRFHADRFLNGTRAKGDL